MPMGKKSIYHGRQIGITHAHVLGLCNTVVMARAQERGKKLDEQAGPGQVVT